MKIVASRAAKTFTELTQIGPVVHVRDKMKTLAHAGCVLHPFLVRAEIRKDVYVDDTEVVWGNDEAGVEWCEYSPRISDRTESRVIEPAVYTTAIPIHVAGLAEHVAVWMLENFSATEIDAMYRLGEGSFRAGIEKAWREGKEAGG